MGNQIVIPSQGEWFAGPLTKIKLKFVNQIESGTFFETLRCLNEEGHQVIVKAYEYNSSLINLPIAKESQLYLEKLFSLANSTISFVSFTNAYIFDRYALLVRPHFEYTLSQRLIEYPLLAPEEKIWISFQLLHTILSLHEIGFAHGSLNPENVFLTWDCRLYVSDPAPFKPSGIRSDRPPFFYHYFGESGCYLAPERILDKKIPEPVIFSPVSKAVDIFSVGCIFYYIFTSKHLFTLPDLLEYKKGNTNHIDECLRDPNIPSEIVGLIKNFIDLQPQKRVQNANLALTTFPKCFNQIRTQINEFFTGDIDLSTVISMIPVFEEFGKNTDYNVSYIFSNIFANLLLNCSNIQSICQFSFFFIDFTKNLSDNVLLDRILPTLVGLLSINNTLVIHSSLLCILKVLGYVKKIPQNLSEIFEDYLTPRLNEILINQKSNVVTRSAFAEFLPLILREIIRLKPSAAKIFIKTFDLLYLQEEILNPLLITTFIKSLLKVTDCTFLFQTIFPVLFIIITRYPPILDIFESFWKYASDFDKVILSKAYSDILQAVPMMIENRLSQQDNTSSNFSSEYMIISQPNQNKENVPNSITSLLNFILVCLQLGLVQKKLYPDIVEVIIPLQHSQNSYHRTIARKISTFFPEFLPDRQLCAFFSKHSIPCRAKSATQYEGFDLIDLPLMPMCPLTLNYIPIGNNPKSKFIRSVRLSRSPLISIDSLSSGAAVVADSKGHIFQVQPYPSLSANDNGIFEYSSHQFNSIGSICCTKSGQTMVSIPDSLGLINWVKNQVTFHPSDLYFNSMLTLSNNVIIGASENSGIIRLFDLRQYEKITEIKICQGSHVSLVEWPCGAIGIGLSSHQPDFNFGLVGIFDTRIMKTFHSSLTNNVLSLSPMYSKDSSCAFAVADEGGIEIREVSNDKVSECCARFAIPYSHLFEIGGKAFSIYKDGVCALDYNGGYIIHDRMTGTPMVPLKIPSSMSSDSLNSQDYDLRMEPFYSIPLSECYKKKPLHYHAASIKGVTQLLESFASIDSIGTVQFWSI